MGTRSRAIAFAVVASLAGTGGTVSAQAPVYQVELVAGSCAEPGAVVASIRESATDTAFDSAPSAMSRVANAFGGTIARGHDAVPLALGHLMAEAHALRLFERYRPPGRLVACGEFGAVDRTVTDVQVGLTGSDGSAVAGVVWLQDRGDGTTTASFVIGSLESTGAPATDDQVQVAISKSLYMPTPLEIPVGMTVTWVNEDALPHTVTTTTPEAPFDSAYMALGDRFSHTFDTAGEFSYFCVFHPRMRALVIVS